MSKDLRNTLIAAAVFLILALVSGYYVYDKYNELEVVSGENQTLEKQIKDLKEVASDKVLETLQKQLKELEINLKEYVKILPSGDVATDENLIRTVSGYVAQAGVGLDNYTTGRGGSKPDFEEITVTLRMKGTFENFVTFCNLLERHESFLRVNSFSLTPTGPASLATATPGSNVMVRDVIPLGISVEVSTFRYLPRK